MTAATKEIEVIDSLSLFALKVAPNIFDLSSGMAHVSIRDQIVRAQLLVRDLKTADESLSSLLVVGAGVAGISAAIAAAELKVHEVVVVDVEEKPFSLLSGVTERYVGPFIYEWPSAFSNNQSYPAHSRTPWTKDALRSLHWRSLSPLPADQLAALLTENLRSKIKNLKAFAPQVFLRINKDEIKNFIRSFANCNSSSAATANQSHLIKFSQSNAIEFISGLASGFSISPKYVLLAAGMGKEDNSLIKEGADKAPYEGENPPQTRFWDNDTLLSEDTCNQKILIFGGGDGAMQDALRALTGHHHPLQLIDLIESNPKAKAALSRLKARLLSLDRQARQLNSWSGNGKSAEPLDAAVEKLASKLAKNVHVRSIVLKAMRIGTGGVTIFVKADYFGKAYLLNRFLVRLIAACSEGMDSKNSGRMRFSVRFGQRAVAYDSEAKYVEVLEESTGLQTKHLGDLFVVRYGIDKATVPGAQLIQLSQRESRQRTTLAGVELPFII